jgi:hypothetical protein
MKEVSNEGSSKDPNDNNNTLLEPCFSSFKPFKVK